MASALKDRGMLELKSLRSRVRRQHGLGRIAKPDADYLVELLDLAEARITSMGETNEKGEEIGE